MKTITTSEGKTCKPRHIPHDAKMTPTQLQNAYDEIADQYEKKIWFDQHILGVARLGKDCFQKQRQNSGCGMWHGTELPFVPCQQ